MIAMITASIAIAAKMFSDRCDHKKNYSTTIVAIVVKFKKIAENVEIGSRKDRCPFSVVTVTIASIICKTTFNIEVQKPKQMRIIFHIQM